MPIMWLSYDIMWYDIVTSCHMTVTVWHLWHDTFPHSLLCSKSKIKEKEKKRNINNGLAILPSHDSVSPYTNGPDINSSMIKSKQMHVSLYSPAKIHTYSEKRKNMITSSANSKHCLLTASRKAITFLTLKMKSKGSSNLHMPKAAHSSLSLGSLIHYVLVSPIWPLDMPPSENTDRDSSLTSPPAAYVVKLRSKPVNTSSWNTTCMTPPLNCATSSLTASSTSSQITLEHLALIMVKVPSRRDSLE